MATTKARYDGHADWYDGFIGPSAPHNKAELIDLLGPGRGLCLDLGCGTGLYFDALGATGRSVIGLDRSGDQLRIARTRIGPGALLHGDAARLPFASGSFPAVAAIWISTDVDDFSAVLHEAARVLQPGGVQVFYGAHPCFNGPHTELLDDGGIIAHPTYQTAGWHRPAPWWNERRVRARVGMRQHPLGELLTAFITAGLSIERVTELGERPIPNTLAIRARKQR